MVYIHTQDTPRSSPVSRIINYPREGGSALETFSVAIKTSPIPDQENGETHYKDQPQAEAWEIRAYMKT